ncbi:hypothetical protein LZZ85_06620 [Terrimonas sp. NA20]|uniref:DUF2262 domain-containing protein n=1 Tax=Terrimonas ginsenosidimutans TaxID=2908004 RepID=A0ABS9KNR2_9BACT|nr:hypothetical protein [Terrimonas ginsenosidimutans]MCG2613946.1 hypothetical protein [Terrimonas ginsenosidimutans]
MKEDFSHLSNDERIRAENSILKMKLMLEKGAKFSEQKTPLPAEIEHEFLKHVIAFEKQLEDYKMVRVFEKIGKPDIFKAVAELSEDEFEAAWAELSNHMRNNGVTLDACSPNISSKELYRFTVEELFEKEIEDFSMPGMMYCFIYDEFYPDPVYDNGQAALHIISSILRRDLVEYLPHLRQKSVQLNERQPLTNEEFRWYINQFKQAYEDMGEIEFEQEDCSVNDKYSVVSGQYKLRVSLQTEYLHLQGQWTVEFEFDEELGFWYIFNVQIEGINF